MVLWQSDRQTDIQTDRQTDWWTSTIHNAITIWQKITDHSKLTSSTLFIGVGEVLGLVDGESEPRSDTFSGTDAVWNTQQTLRYKYSAYIAVSILHKSCVQYGSAS